MLKIKGLRLSGIGRFVDTQDIDIESLGNLIQVDAQNLNTGGSSGSGKSTLFNALDYLLGLNDLPVTVLQSRLTKEGISVRGVFDFNGKPLLITRNKKGLIIDLDGEVTQGSSKLSEEKLDEIIGMPRDLFRKILHKRQKEGGFFLDFTPKKMYEFLTDCLNLAEVRKKEAIIDKKWKELDAKKLVLVGDLDKAKAGLSATQESILALGLAPVRDIHQAVILELKQKMDKSVLNLTTKTEEYKVQNELLDKQRPVLEPNPVLEAVPQPEVAELEKAVEFPLPVLEDITLNNASVIQELENQQKSLSDEITAQKEAESKRVKSVSDVIQEKKLNISALTHKINLAETARTESVKIANEVKKIRDAICPTCEQTWVTEAASVKEKEKLIELAGYKAQIEAGAAAKMKIDQETADIAILEGQKSTPQKLAEWFTVVEAKLVDTKNLIAAEKSKADIFKTEAVARNTALSLKYNADRAAESIRIDGINKVKLAEVSARNAALSKEITERNDKKLAEVSAKNASLTKEYGEKVTAVREVQSRDLEQLRGQVDVDRRAFEAAVNKLKAYEEANTRYESALAQMKAKELEYNTIIDKNEKDLAIVDSNLKKAEELLRAVKLFLSCSFDDALESIGDAATRIIRNIPTMSNSTIQFEGQKETQEGKIKEEVNAVISMDGEIGIPIKSLSGGERSAVDLAVDLAVIDFIESETSKGIDIFILDEPFTGLDTVGIEMALEVLKNSNTNKKLIVVDHNPEVKQLVSNRLVVVRDGLTSKVLASEVVNG